MDPGKTRAERIMERLGLERQEPVRCDREGYPVEGEEGKALIEVFGEGHDNPALAVTAALFGEMRTHTAIAKRVGETVRYWASCRAGRNHGIGKVAEWGRRTDLRISTERGLWFAEDA